MKITRDPNIPAVVWIAAERAGPRVVIFAGVHGDEVSGVHAIEKLLFDFFTGARTLRQGSLTLVRGNERALAAERRYLTLNLNRLFRDAYAQDVDRTAYEFTRAQELKTILHDCDYFLDCHSAPIAQDEFLVAERPSLGFFAQLGIPRIITGWGKFSAGAIGGDAENYANAHGALAATLESGSHFAKSSIDVANRATTRMLARLQMIEAEEDAAAEPVTIFEMYAVVTKDYGDFRYAGEASCFQLIPNGEAFAFQNGQPLRVAEDSYLLIPMRPADTKVAEEVCYLGRKLSAVP